MATATHTHDHSPFLPRTPRGKRRTRGIAEPSELAALYQLAGPGMRFLLICWTQLGMRFREPLKITPAKYNRLTGTISTTVKGNNEREYPVTKQLAEVLESVEPLRDDQHDTPYYAILHGRTYNGKPIRWLTDVARREWVKCRQQAGVDPNLHIHDLRRTAATNIHRITGDVLAAQQLLGHRDLSTTTYYLKPLEQERMRELIEQLDTRWIQ